jgi:hypothetical protein
MPKLQHYAELDRGLRIAAENAPSDVPTTRLAEQFYEANRDIVGPMVDGWIVEKLAALIGKHRAKVRRAESQQLVFEEMLGFTHLPSKITLKSGEKVKRAEATRGQLRQERSRRVKDHGPVVQELDSAIELMGKYSRSRKHRKITWAEVLEKEAARSPSPKR